MHNPASTVRGRDVWRGAIICARGRHNARRDRCRGLSYVADAMADNMHAQPFLRISISFACEMRTAQNRDICDHTRGLYNGIEFKCFLILSINTFLLSSSCSCALSNKTKKIRINKSFDNDYDKL